MAVPSAAFRDHTGSGGPAGGIDDGECNRFAGSTMGEGAAELLSFASITARGFDIGQAQIQRARLLTQDLTSLPGVTVTFDVADLTDRLAESDASVDLTLCLYSVLSHLPIIKLPDVATELARVTSGHFVTTVRSIGSPPTAFVDSIERVRRLKHDHVRDLCEIELSGGRSIAYGFHLFAASELSDHFARTFDIEDLRDLDLVHSRFMPDHRWHPAYRLADNPISDELIRLEKAQATHPAFIDRATHLLLVARSGRLTARDVWPVRCRRID